ncbi:MAG: hypothetical protein M3R17_17995 [Bacteroidota bacterium]|nr:hypothetical protein [Bacteroidota bacterium]
MRHYLCLLVLLFPGILSSKNDSLDLPKNAIYAEGGGPAYTYSINYARYFRTPDLIGSIRIGAAYVNFEETFSMPLEGTLLIGGKRHFVEFGMAVIFFSKLTNHHASPGASSLGYNDYQTKEQGLNLSARVGYCFFPLHSNRIMCRAGFTPIVFAKNYGMSGDITKSEMKLWGGVSLGYAF